VKLIKNILIFILMLSHVCCMSTISAKTNEDGSYAQKLSKLAALKLLPDNIDFSKPEAAVKRAEFVSIILSYTGNTELIPDKVNEDLFTDVDRDHLYARVIAAGVSLGILSGFSDGRFYPEEEITAEQAVKVIVCIFGYRVKAEAKGGYPTGYLSVAGDIKLLKRVDLSNGLTNESLITLLDNGLNAEIVDVSKFNDDGTTVYKKQGSFLEANHNIFIFEDVVNATVYNAAIGCSLMPDGFIKIGTTTFYDGNIENIQSYMGYRLKVYYKKDSTDDYGAVLFYEILNKNIVTYVNAENIKKSSAEFSAYSFVYSNENDMAKKVDLTNATVVYNGRTEPYYNADDISPETGDVTLLDNNDDGKIDYVYVFKCINAVLLGNASVGNDDIMLNNLIDAGSYVSIKTKQKNNYILFKDGIKADISVLSEYDTLLVGFSKDFEFAHIKASSKAVEGIIKAVNLTENKITIGDKEYAVSKQCIENAGNSEYMASLKTGINAFCYLDIYDTVQSVKKIDDNKLFYGYVLKVDTANDEKGLSDSWKVKLLKTDSETEIFEFADKVLFDGINKTSKNAAGSLATGGNAEDLGKGEGCRQLIKYAINEDKKISKIYTTASNENIKYDGFYTQARDYGYYLGTWGRRFYRTAETHIFCIYPDDDLCEVTHNYDNRVLGIITYFYDINEIMTAGAVIRNYSGSKTDTNGTIAESRNFVMVKYIKNVLDEEGLEGKALVGYTTTGKMVEIMVGERTNDYIKSIFNSVIPGDVVIYDTDTKGSLSALVKVLDSTKLDVYGANGTTSDTSTGTTGPQGQMDLMWLDKTRWQIYGEIDKFVGGNVLYFIKKDDNGNPELTRDSITTAPMACLDLTGNEPKITYKFNYKNIRHGDKILIWGKWQYVKDVIIIRDK